MTETPTLLDNVSQTFRDHGLTAAITALMGGSLAVAAAVTRRHTPEADLQRSVVRALRVALPRTAIIHHCANEVTEPGPRGAKRQAILVGMGVHAGFADLMVIRDARVLFLELKAPRGRLRPDQEAFRDAVLAQGFGWALIRSLDDALGALADHGFTSRVRPARRAAP